MNRKMIDPLTILEESHMLSILDFLADNEPCTKTTIYAAISRSTRMPDKLDMLADADLIEMMSVTKGRSVIRLTSKGRAVSEYIRDIRRMMNTETTSQ